MNFSSKSILASVLVIGSLALGYFLVWPKWGDYSIARAALQSANTEQTNIKLAQQQLSSFLGEYKKHTSEAQKLNQSLPLSSSEMYNILNNMDFLTKSSGLTLGALTFLDTPEGDTLGAAAHSIQPVNLSISGSGSYPALKNFLVSLESNLRLIDIDTLTVSSEVNTVNFVINFKTYYQN